MKNFNPAKYNCEIYDKELLVIIRCFEEWKPELKKITMPIKIIIDHKSFEYFMTIKNQIKRQNYWTKFLFDFNFVVFYMLNKKNPKLDSLTCYPNNLLSGKNDDC